MAEASKAPGWSVTTLMDSDGVTRLDLLVCYECSATVRKGQDLINEEVEQKSNDNLEEAIQRSLEDLCGEGHPSLTSNDIPAESLQMAIEDSRLTALTEEEQVAEAIRRSQRPTEQVAEAIRRSQRPA